MTMMPYTTTLGKSCAGTAVTKGCRGCGVWRGASSGGEDESAPNQFSTPAYVVDSAFQGEEALEMVQKSELQNAPYSLVFMDIRMPPGWDGIETIRRIWEQYPHIEMVICTAYSDYSWEEILNKIGNSDLLLFLRKPFDTVAVKQMALALTRKWLLARTVQGSARQLEIEVSERRKSEERLSFQATHDVLTGLANRASLDEFLRTALEAAEKNQKGGLFYVNLDRFKEINETLGYKNGDLVIKEAGSRLKECLENRGLVARVCGNEFAVVIPLIESSEASDSVQQQIRKALEPPFVLESLQLEVRASVSIVLFPDHGTSVDDLLRRAAIAMLEAKKPDGT